MMEIQESRLATQSNNRFEQLSDEDFKVLAAHLYRVSGIFMPIEKKPLMQSRLLKRLRSLKLSNFSDYCKIIHSNESAAETNEMVTALSTNVTRFFREASHFELLRDRVLATRKKGCPKNEIRLWSAGCATGEEPVSMAIISRERLHGSQPDILILATDISNGALEVARAGIYQEAKVAEVPVDLRQRYFKRMTQKNGHYIISESISSLIRYRKLNLFDPWPMRKKFDAIFCRNVVIYFDSACQKELWSKFADALNPGGFLFIGHSERIPKSLACKFDCIGAAAYQVKGENL